MNTKLNLEPLEKYLTEDITPEQLASVLDELFYDYSQIIIFMYETLDEPFQYIHEESSNFLYHLKALRDVLKKCKM